MQKTPRRLRARTKLHNRANFAPPAIEEVHTIIIYDHRVIVCRSNGSSSSGGTRRGCMLCGVLRSWLLLLVVVLGSCFVLQCDQQGHCLPLPNTGGPRSV